MKHTLRSDQRRTGRFPQEALVRYSVGGQDDYRPARMFNYSNSGMYLEIDYPPPKLGASLLIEVMDAADGNAPIEAGDPRTCYYAQVIWKRNLSDSQASYGIGLRYLSMAAAES